MTIHAVAVPRWGLTMEEGTITGWQARPGDTIARGAELVEIETSKIANVVEAAEAGTLRRIVADEGAVKKVGALIGVITDGDEDDAAIDAFVADFESRFAVEEATGPSAPTPETIAIDGETSRFLLLDDTGGAGAAPALLLHGFGGDLHNWMFNQTAWAADRPAYALELPGHGSSSKAVGDGSLATLARRAIAFLDAKDLARVHLVGHSMGAGVALTVAQLAPGRVLSVSAVCGAGFGGTLNRDYIEGFIAAQKRKDMKPVVELLFADPGLVTREMLDDLVAYKRLDGVPEALRTIADAALSEESLAALHADVGVPVLALFGAEDQVFPTPAAPDEAVIAGVGHMAHMEAADAVNARIADFLRAND
ncbi:acetoin dehydrogenase dihydrolipoyllysine-residue acetyltransferase subunit [Sphingomonas profundi]|uniref:acetoin dehydrogenase dihydrolipoyllysine-residue acetyltransferase subunit n=1 Tax=Alterirhizorhabdus profundi TaxID=2681549 RepID=UPI0012E875F0|nr:acetoin dehydrogenase dihydrolipoyllysine-residue acetyltransferase subunit [Sphingomonas profundi]